VSTPLPEGQQGAKPSTYRQRVAAINQTAWDSTAAVSFSFKEITIISGTKRNLVQVEWAMKVLYNTQTIEGIAYENGKNLPTLKNRCYKKGMTTSIMIHSGLSRLSNYEMLVLQVMQDNQEALLITYASGGSTPGDSYVWFVDQNYRPKAWRMWVSIIPVGGLETTWEKIENISNNLKLQNHKGLIDLKLEDVETINRRN
jgi:hypothetical protein